MVTLKVRGIPANCSLGAIVIVLFCMYVCEPLVYRGTNHWVYYFTQSNANGCFTPMVIKPTIGAVAWLELGTQGGRVWDLSASCNGFETFCVLCCSWTPT